MKLEIFLQNKKSLFVIIVQYITTLYLGQQKKKPSSRFVIIFSLSQLYLYV